MHFRVHVLDRTFEDGIPHTKRLEGLMAVGECRLAHRVLIVKQLPFRRLLDVFPDIAARFAPHLVGLRTAIFEDRFHGTERLEHAIDDSVDPIVGRVTNFLQGFLQLVFLLCTALNDELPDGNAQLFRLNWLLEELRGAVTDSLVNFDDGPCLHDLRHRLHLLAEVVDFFCGHRAPELVAQLTEHGAESCSLLTFCEVWFITIGAHDCAVHADLHIVGPVT